MTSFTYFPPSLLARLSLCRGFASSGIHKRWDLNLGWLWRLGSGGFGGIGGRWLLLFVSWFLVFGITLVPPFPFHLLIPRPLP